MLYIDMEGQDNPTKNHPDPKTTKGQINVRNNPMIAKILKLFKRAYNWTENLFCIEPANRKKDHVKEQMELAKVFGELNNPRSRMEILTRQTTKNLDTF